MPSVVSFLKGQRKPNCEEGGGRREGKKKGGGHCRTRFKACLGSLQVIIGIQTSN